MAEEEPQLIKLLTALRNAFGLQYLQIKAAITKHMRTTPPEVVLREIEQIRDLELIRHLLACGVPSRYFDKLIEVMSRLASQT
jgi:hypothetical protein